jgi:hypothetical protein
VARPGDRDGKRIAAYVFWAAAAVFLVVGGVFYKVSGTLDAQAARLASAGVEVLAEVVERRIVTRHEVDRDGDERTVTSHYVTVAYATAAGDRVEVEEQVGASRYQTLPEGAQVPVIYLPEEPTVLEFLRGETRGEAGVFRWLGIGLAALGGLLAVAGLVLRRRAAA